MTEKVKAVSPARHEINIFRERLLKWSLVHERSFPWRQPDSPNYKIVIAELFLQRTKAETVAKFLPVFFQLYPSWAKLASTTRPSLEKALGPIGLSGQRAPRLLALAKIIARKNGRLPREREEIDDLPGVGQYVANAIELLCFNRPRPLLDVNMARVLERYFGPRQLADIRHDPYLQELAQRVVDCEDSARINFAILDFASLVCKARNPLCSECILRRTCRFLRESR